MTSKFPTIRVTSAAIVHQCDRFLIVEETVHGRRVLNQPSGRLERSETIVQTAIREAAEEASVSIRPTALVGIYFTPQHSESQAQPVLNLRFAFAAELLADEPTVQRDPAVLGTHWMTVDALRDCSYRHRSTAVLRCIEDYLAGHRFPLELINLNGMLEAIDSGKTSR